MLLRVQLERQEGGFFPSLKEYAKFFGLNKKKLSYAKENVLILHPGPINRGVEITPDVAESKNAKIGYQVELGIAVRMALLYLLSRHKK
jgi:aspartate carbamoyltransferase catalytic subunit